MEELGDHLVFGLVSTAFIDQAGRDIAPFPAQRIDTPAGADHLDGMREHEHLFPGKDRRLRHGVPPCLHKLSDLGLIIIWASLKALLVLKPSTLIMFANLAIWGHRPTSQA